MTVHASLWTNLGTGDSDLTKHRAFSNICSDKMRQVPALLELGGGAPHLLLMNLIYQPPVCTISSCQLVQNRIPTQKSDAPSSPKTYHFS
jgi:hypothetical protein